MVRSGLAALIAGTLAQIPSRVNSFRGLCMGWKVASVPESSDSRTQSLPSMQSATSAIFWLPVPLDTMATCSPSFFMKRMTSANFGYRVGSPPPITITERSPLSAMSSSDDISLS